MTEEEYEIYNNLPETFTVYRGVASGRNAKGMSWTQNLEVAKWFANRFNCGKKGYIQQATANKKDVLAYFNRRDEDEIKLPSITLDAFRSVTSLDSHNCFI